MTISGVELGEIDGRTIAMITLDGDAPYEATGETNDDGEQTFAAVV